MMIANYHSHTWRCNHASGTEESYVQTALDAGMQILGFSDHSPYFFPGDYYSHFRMRPEQLKGYCETVRDLAQTYRSDIDIHLGVELEYYPKYLPRLLPFLQDHGVEYCLLGQHFLGNEIGQYPSGGPTGDETILERYCRQSMEAMHTGLFTYFAHPDLMDFRGDSKVYREHISRMCREAADCGMPLELNLLGIREGRCYPNPRFWELAAEAGCSVILGCDAHEARVLNDPTTEKKALRMLEKLGLSPLDTVPLRKI